MRLYDLIYLDLDTLLGDIVMLMEDQRFDQMESFLFPTATAWVYLLEAIGFHDGDGPPDDAVLLDGLRHVAHETADPTFLELVEPRADEPADAPEPVV